MRRTRWLQIRVTVEEHAELKRKAGKRRLSNWARQLLLATEWSACDESTVRVLKAREIGKTLEGFGTPSSDVNTLVPLESDKEVEDSGLEKQKEPFVSLTRSTCQSCGCYKDVMIQNGIWVCEGCL